ncbi:MAG: hypothetical protein H7Z41_14335 [Cytophagales bacterium]|nr:hypothetical protein [Armatimonadota bacterium]
MRSNHPVRSAPFIVAAALSGIVSLPLSVLAQPTKNAPAPSPKAGGPATPAQPLRFKDIDLDFTQPEGFQQPKEGSKELTSSDAYEAYGVSINGFKSHIELVLFNNLPKNAVISKDIIEQIGKQFGEKKEIRDYKQVAQGNITVAGASTPFVSSTFRFASDKTKQLLRNKQVLFVHKDVGYMFIFTADAEKFATLVPAFDSLIASIQFPSAAEAVVAPVNKDGKKK